MIELDELILYPLNAEELSLWLNDLPQLEKKLNCTYCAEPMEGIFKDVVQSELILAMSDVPEHWLWYTFWFMIRKSDSKVIGSLCFKGAPENNNGETEIGYGLGKEFEHHGYMTKSVKALCDWALQQPNIKAVTAETDIDGKASQNILTRCGFTQTHTTDMAAYYKKSI